MVLALTVPNGTPDAIKPLLLEGSGPPFPVTVLDLGTPLTTLDPLTRELYVDAGTPGTLAQQNGSIAFPFATVQQGVDALALLGGGALLIAPGTYNEIVSGGTVPIDFINPGLSAGAVVTLTAVSSNGGQLAFAGISLTNVSVGSLASSVRFDRMVVTGSVVCGGLTVNNCTLTSSVTCTTLVAQNSNFNSAVSASSVMILKECVFLSSLATTVAGGTTRLEDCRLATTYSAVGAGTTTVALGCHVTGNFSATIAEIANCTLNGQLNTSGNATVRFTSVAQQCGVGGAATFYQARMSNVTTITGALTTDFASISGVLPVLTYGSIVVQETAPRININVAVPAVAAGAVAYVNAALAGTDLVGMVTATSMVVANPTADLVAAGPGGGLLNVRFSAANTVRFCFLGPLAAQPAATFVLGLV